MHSDSAAAMAELQDPPHRSLVAEAKLRPAQEALDPDEKDLTGWEGFMP